MTVEQQNDEIRVFEAFAGYGSQSLALERLHRDFPAFRYRVVGYSEIDPTAIKAYTALHGDIPNFGDISRIDWARVPDFDLLTYSFPCTNISAAGQQKGLAEGSGTASSLLWECRKAIAAKRPGYLLMENVKALVSKKFLPYFNMWRAELDGYGYTSFAKVLNAADYGVPQHRERIFMVSILGENAGYSFPEPLPLTRRLKDVLEDSVDECFYLSDKRVQGLIRSTLKEREAGRGFEFKPKTGNDTANALTGSCIGRKTDNFLVCGAIRGRKEKPADKKNVLRVDCHQQDTSNALTTQPGDNVVIIGRREDVANTVTAHYAKEKTGNAVRQSLNRGTFVMERELRQGDVTGSMQANASRSSIEGVSPTITAACGTGGGQTPMVVESEPQVLRMERTEEERLRRHNEGDRGAKFSAAKEMKPRKDGVSNCVTSCLKDNLVCEPQMQAFEQARRICESRRGGNGTAVLEENGTIRGRYNADGHGVSISEMVVQHEDNPAMTVTTHPHGKVYGGHTGWRIRKLTPRECGRLMDCDDMTIDKMIAAGIPKTRLYKLYGNSIVISVLYHIFRTLFINTEKTGQLTLF